MTRIKGSLLFKRILICSYYENENEDSNAEKHSTPHFSNLEKLLAKEKEIYEVNKLSQDNISRGKEHLLNERRQDFN